MKDVSGSTNYKFPLHRPAKVAGDGWMHWLVQVASGSQPHWTPTSKRDPQYCTSPGLSPGFQTRKGGTLVLEPLCPGKADYF